MRRLVSLLFFLLATQVASAQLIHTGGAALSSTTAAPPISVSVTPSISTVTVSTTQKFTVSLLNDTQNAGAFWTLNGPACLGVTCGTISNSNSVNGGNTTYTAPSVVPANPTVFLIAASVTDPTRFITATITVFQSSGGGGGGGTTPAPMVLNNRTPIAASFPSATTGSTSVNFTALQGTLLNVYVFLPFAGSAVSSVTDPNGDVFMKASCVADISGGGHVEVFDAFSAKIGTSTVTINWTSAGAINGIGVIIRDISNNSSVNTANATCGGSTVSTSTPSGPGVVAGAGSLVISGIQVNEFGGVFSGVIPPPFTVSTTIPNYPSAGGTDLAAPVSGTYSPNWQLTQPEAWAGITISFSAGSGGGGGGGSNITVAISPTTASLGTSATQLFTTTVTNDSTNSGASYLLTGAGCSGATCGTLNTGSVISLNTFTTCGNTATPSMTCTLASTSVGNLLVLESGGGGANLVTKVVDNKNNTWVQGPGAASNGCTNTADNDRTQEWHAVGAAPGVTALTITVTPTGGSLFGFQELHVYDLSGADPVSPLADAECQNNGSSNTNFVGPSATTTLGGGFVIAGIQASNGVSTIDSPFTFDDNHVAHDLNASPGTFTPSWHAGTAGTWTAFTSTFKPSSIATGNVLYTAPGTQPSPNTVTLSASSVKDPTKIASATITIGGSPVIGVSVSPPNATLSAGGAPVTFTATVTNDSAGVNWTILQNGTPCTGGCGSLNSTSTASQAPNPYTPPATLSTNLSIALKACSITLPTTCSSANVLVTPAAGPPNCNGPCPAFPGAQGGGAAAAGGRGGVVYNITDSSDTTHSSCAPFNPDSVACSLRDCVQATGARTCIFRFSGRIAQTSRLQVFHPFLTIAGQTAPGGGIVQGGVGSSGNALFISTNDVIVRYMTYDGAVSSISGSTCNPDTGSVGLEIASANNFNIIIDHNSHRWWGNKDFEMISNGPTNNVHGITMQWNMAYEPCNDHPVFTEPDVNQGGSQFASVDQDWHHNFVANSNHRHPLCAIRQLRWVNNIVYNTLQESDDFNWSCWGAVQADITGNKYVDGPNSTFHVFNIVDQPDPTSSLDKADCNPSCDNGPAQGRYPGYRLLNNVGHSGTNTGGTPIAFTHTVNDAGQLSMFAAVTNAEGAKNPTTPPGASNPNSCGGPSVTCWFRSSPLPLEAFPITEDPAENLDNVILATVGNSQHLDCNGNFISNRDSQDQRVISQYLAHGPGGPWSGPNYKGPLNSDGSPEPPAIPAGTACTETLHDGIPDAWRSRYHITAAGSATDQASKYTYLEDYLNGIVPTP